LTELYEKELAVFVTTEIGCMMQVLQGKKLAVTV
jgi:hypothetical protein